MATHLKHLIWILLLCSQFEGIAQYNDEDYSGSSDLLSVGVNAGVATFFGDLSKEADLSKYTNIKTGFGINIERRFGSFLGLQLNSLFGKLAYNEISRDVNYNRNFESSIFSLSANAIFNLDNDFIIKRKSPFAPFIGVGVGFTKFDSFGDLKDGKNNTYYYWQDGSIIDLDENDANATDANRIFRDYNYETRLSDSIANYGTIATTIPLTFGLKWKFNPNVQARIYATYHLSQTDWIDNVSENSNNDRFLYTGFAISYTFKRKDPNEISYKDVDMKALNNSDSDGDGIKDINDYCQGTPKNVQVNSNGCPNDGDKDGVPDYIDKEAASEVGAIVDEFGVTLSDEMISNRFVDYQDSIVEERIEVFSDASSIEELNQMESKIQERFENDEKNRVGIPENLIEADADQNGFISAQEISLAIDGFFEGTNDFSVQSIHALINYFFEQ